MGGPSASADSAVKAAPGIIQHVIENSFHGAFCLRDWQTGRVRRFGRCEFQGDTKALIGTIDGKAFRLYLDYDNDGEFVSPDDLVTYGYHDDEWGEWVTVAAQWAKVEKSFAAAK